MTDPTRLQEALVQARTPLASRDFRLLLIGQTTSQLGTQVSGVAVPLLAVFTLHATPIQLGLVTASSTIGFALLGLPAGAWLDRCRRRPVLVASDVARALLLLTVPLAALFDALSIGWLVAVSLLTGLARTFFDVGYPSYLPTVTGKDGVLAGNSVLETARSTGQVAGPGLGGWLVSIAGAANVVLIQAVTFAISAWSLAAIRTRETPAPRDPASRPRLWADVRAGLVFVLATRVLLGTAVTSAASNLAFAVASAVTFLFMSDVVGLSATGIGVVVAVGAVAAMAGAALTPRLARRFGTTRITWLALVVTTPVALLGPFAEPGWRVALLVVGTVAGELGQIVYAITSLSLRQRVCPDHLLGRVNATIRFVVIGGVPLGALVGGVLGELLGLRVTLWIALSIVALSALPTYLAVRD